MAEHMSKVKPVNPLKKKSVDRPKNDGNKTVLGGKAAEVEVNPQMQTRGRGKVFAKEHVVVAWGRMNPPTIGHERMLQEVAAIADEYDGDAQLWLSESALSKTNPLTHTQRVELAEKAFGHLVEVVSEKLDLIGMLKSLAEHYKHVTIVTGQEHTDDYVRILKTYNGKDFVFETTEVVTIERDPDSDELDENISATRMRDYVSHNDSDSFSNGLPRILRDDADSIMETIRFSIDIQQILESDAKSYAEVARQAVIRRRNNG